jgi:hypothetical protein
MTGSEKCSVSIQVVGCYKIVKFEGAFYVCPHGQEVNWERDDVAKFPGVLVSDSQDHVIAMLRR